MFYKPREEICVASMINGTMIVGTFNKVLQCIDEPIAFTYRHEFKDYDEKTGKGVGEPIGINFAPGLVGDPELKAKAVFIEGQADIKKFNFSHRDSYDFKIRLGEDVLTIKFPKKLIRDIKLKQLLT